MCWHGQACIAVLPASILVLKGQMSFIGKITDEHLAERRREIALRYRVRCEKSFEEIAQMVVDAEIKKEKECQQTQ